MFCVAIGLKHILCVLTSSRADCTLHPLRKLRATVARVCVSWEGLFDTCNEDWGCHVL